MTAFLVLEDGTIFEGIDFGAERTVSGEVVFNTGMVGYTESITDASYNGQILCQTYPLIGNYGVCRDDFESDSAKIEAYIVRELCRQPSHAKAGQTLDDFLKESGVPGIAGIDTRMLTKKLRMKGVMLGVLSNILEKDEVTEKARKIEDPNNRDLVREVTIEQPMFYEKNADTVVVIDCGMKYGILRELTSRFNVARVPASYSAEKIMDFSPKGVVISNGPGDPKKVDYVIDTVRNLMEYRMPIFGICLGNQILALASGGNTYKLKFGHRGQNHPCIGKDGKCYITSQNHGFAVSDLVDFNISFVNANDKTVEGIEHEKLPVFGVQFHPEASPGPTDTRFLFDKFAKMIRNE